MNMVNDHEQRIYQSHLPIRWEWRFQAMASSSDLETFAAIGVATCGETYVPIPAYKLMVRAS